MRNDSVQFAQAARARSKRPRYIIRIVYDTASPALTSHDDITGVPGDVIQGVLQEPAAVSQRIVPDEGRSEIGSFSFSLIDKDAAFTEKLRAKQDDDGEGIRGKTVIFYDGYEGFDFSAFQVFQTQIVQYLTYANGAYKVQCADITREQRQNIFEPKFTTLRASVSAADTTIPVYVTDGFQTIVHGTSWSDAPSATVGYIKVQDEVIRYTGKTADSFTGCARGVLNTKAVDHAVDAGTSAERRTKVDEYIYIELPAVKLAWAVLTGQLYGSANTLPSHWHLGIDPSFLRESDFTGIGPDLWNTADDTAALVLRFEALKKTDGKRFLEKEIYLVLGCYSPVYSDGALGLRRLPALLGDAAPVATLTEREVISVSDLVHDDASMHNTFRVNWNYDPQKDAFTRITYFTDADSVSVHGRADLKEYSFKGLHGSRHTDVIVAQRLNALRDAYAYPPERITVTVQGSLSGLEIGDVVRLRLQSVRDYAGATNAIDRAFAIFQKTHNSARNTVNLELFGSTARPLATPPGTSSTAPLPDSWYTSTGANLNTIATITANVMATGSYTINGNASLTASGAVFYWNGDLTIPAGCNLTITGNVQLRIRGFLTLNGTINGTGGGKSGVSDPGTGSWDATFSGNAGFIGNSRGWDGIRSNGQVPRTPHQYGQTIGVPTTRGQFESFPFIELKVVGSSLTGLPSDLRGTGGGPGGRLISSSNSIVHIGDAGVAGGAGLAIICRGMAFGVSASITLNGVNSASTTAVQSLNGVPSFPGAGGPGGPGGLLILLDGNSISVPDVTGKVIAATGSLTQSGNPMVDREQVITTIDGKTPNERTNPPYSGYPDPGLIGPWAIDSANERVVMSALDMSNAAHRIQYVPESQTPASDADVKPPAPTGLTVAPTGSDLTWRATVQFTDSADVLELYVSIDNNRSNAVRIAWGRITEFTQELPTLATRYGWVRVRRDFPDRPDQFSDWYPSSSTGGISTTTLNPNGWTPVATAASGATMVVSAAQVQKSGGTTAWDSQVYSRESYAGGCVVSFRPVQSNANFIIGVNADPATDASYTSIDYAWYCTASGIAEIYQSGTNVQSVGSYDTSTTFAITYDGVWVRFLKNGSVVREVYDVGQAFFMDSSWYTPGATAASIQFVATTTVRPVAFIPRGNCNVSDTNIIKQGGSGAWDSDAYSIQSLPVCHVAFKGNQTNAEIMVGLNRDPVTDSSYTSLDRSWHLTNSGTLEIYENGVNIGSYGSYTTSTLLAITYDGTNVRYFKDDLTTPVRTDLDAGLTFFFDSSFYTPGGGINSLRFGPTTNLAVTDTSQIGQNAATEYGSTSSSSGSVNSAAFSGPPTVVDNTIITLSYTNNSPETQTVEVFSVCRYSISGTGAGWICAPRVVGTLLDQGGSYATSATDQIYSFAGQVTVAAGASATFTLAAEYKTAGSGAAGLVLSWSNANLKYNVLKR